MKMFKVIIISVLMVHTAVYAVQYANYFQVNIHANNALSSSIVLSVITHSGVLKESGYCSEDRIVYTISGEMFSNPPTVTIRHFLSLMLVDMKAHYISELNKLNSNTTAGELQSKTKINAMTKQIENIIPNCKLILLALDYLYNKDVDFEDLLSSYYAICVVPRKWIERFKEDFQSTNNDYKNPYLRLSHFLTDKFILNNYEVASSSFFTDSKNQMTQWNMFLENLNVNLSMYCFIKQPNTFWMNPEWLTFGVLMENKIDKSDSGMQMLLQSPIQVNNIYKTISATEVTLSDLYHNTVRQDVNPKTLLAYYNVVLQKIDEVIDTFLYRHVLMIYTNMISDMTDDAILEKLNRLMKSCNWQFIMQHLVNLLMHLKCSYTVTFNRTKVMNFISDKSWHNDYLLARTAMLRNPEAKNLTSGLLKMFPSNVTDRPDQLILSRGFKYDYSYTDKYIWRNCNQAFDYTRKLCNITSEHFGLELDLTDLQKFKRIKTI